MVCLDGHMIDDDGMLLNELLNLFMEVTNSLTFDVPSDMLAPGGVVDSRRLRMQVC